LKENGLRLKMPFAKKIGNKLWELRTSGKQKVRIIYSIEGNQIYLIHWFIKKTQKIPIKELKTAIKRLTEI
jgi:phage-related protein